jgi:deoxyribose-phosphate aldolase
MICFDTIKIQSALGYPEMIKNRKLKKLYETYLKNATDLTESTVGAKNMFKEKKFSSLNSYIDHTLLKPEATIEQIKVLCEEATKHSFKTVCVQPMYVKDCTRFLKKSNVLPITVVGFPLGANTIESKLFEAKNAIENGAKEIDMVWNISAVKSKRYDYVFDEISAMVESCGKIPVKVIIETSCLSQDEKVFACACVSAASAAFIKTSTGFSSAGAQLEDILLFKKLLKNSVQIKASGGIKSVESAKKFLEAGATRLGTSSGADFSKGDY